MGIVGVSTPVAAAAPCRGRAGSSWWLSCPRLRHRLRASASFRRIVAASSREELNATYIWNGRRYHTSNTGALKPLRGTGTTRPLIYNKDNPISVQESFRGTKSEWSRQSEVIRAKHAANVVAKTLESNNWHLNGCRPLIDGFKDPSVVSCHSHVHAKPWETESTNACIGYSSEEAKSSTCMVQEFPPSLKYSMGSSSEINAATHEASIGTPNSCTLEPSDKQGLSVDKQDLSETKSSQSRCKHAKDFTDIFPSVLVVDTIALARKTVRMLITEYKDLVHACDTEVAAIDVKQETPVDHGNLICFSIYSGPTVDFGDGKSYIWVDVLDGERNILQEFAPFFEDNQIKKVWHNYSFDCHIIRNYGINISGLYADTMHLARLWDSSRRMDGGYSLEALTSNAKVMSRAHNNGDVRSKMNIGSFDHFVGKISMKDVFGKKKLKKDGTEGKITTIAPVEELQRKERKSWICYSVRDSFNTFALFESLKEKLMKKPWNFNGVRQGTMFDFYKKYWQPFGALLVEMEAAGILVDREHLSEIEKVATAEQQVAAEKFRKWATKYCPDAKYMNVGSDTQLRQLFFGGIANIKDQNEFLPVSKCFKAPNVDNIIEDGKKSASKYLNITIHKIGEIMHTELYTQSGWPSVSVEALKIFAGKVSADLRDDFSADADIQEHESSSKDVEVKGLSEYGTAYVAFGKGKQGRDACHAIAALCEICSIDSLISNFILPLQGDSISGKEGRIHCSLNINTETGRLSARRPNLQNPPALEKDRYKIRQAFVAAPGNSLIVADYGQLELRILAHLANCKSMLNAFEAGGDFHSRTAMNMYPYIRDAVESNEVLLEWHPQAGEEKPPVPLLKDAFAAERRKAKMLNFSIAYGKTPVGLSRDWKVSVHEAKETVRRWYNGRQEVLKWQQAQKKEAVENQCVYTLLGRARRFPSITNLTNSQRGHIERAAINTPVQGSAADVAMCAMLEIARNQRLKDLKWRLLLQVHDEVILEGPSESAEEAKAIVVDCMSKPFNGKNILSVELSVDAKCAQNWYAAK